MKKRSNAWFIILLSILIISINSCFVLAIDINSCGTLNIAGATYIQTQNIIPTANANCIIINNENITYNGNGFWIANSTNANSGIYSNQDNTTIKNCEVDMSTATGGHGIELSNSNNSYVFNNIANNNSDYGIFLNRGSNKLGIKKRK